MAQAGCGIPCDQDRAQSNDGRRHTCMQVNTMFPDTLCKKGMAMWILKSSIKKARGEKKNIQFSFWFVLHWVKKIGKFSNPLFLRVDST